MLLLLTRCQLQENVENKATNDEKVPTSAQALNPSVNSVLSQSHHCNKAIVIRSQALSKELLSEACDLLIAQENNFHQTFDTLGKSVADDNNHTMLANVYGYRDEFVKYSTEYFTMPTNNGGKIAKSINIYQLGPVKFSFIDSYR